MGDILQAFVAFAVTMLALSTVVTAIMEMATRLFSRRARIFKRLLEVIFDDLIAPLIEKKDVAAQQLDTQLFVDGVTASPLKFYKENRMKSVKIFRGLMKRLGAEDAEKVPTQELVRRVFEQAEVRTALKDKSEDEIKDLIDEIEDKYDELCVGAKDYLKNSSRILSLIVGVVLAVVVNIDAHRILTYYIDNPVVAKKIADQAETYADEYKEQQDAYAEARNKLEELEKAKAAEADVNDARASVAAARADIALVQARIDNLRAERIPIGGEFYPHCYWGGPENCKEVWVSKPDVTEAKNMTERAWEYFNAAFVHHFWEFVGWLFWVGFTGILIGLGGPFWYDAVKGVMHLTQLMRGRSASPPSVPSSVASGATDSQSDKEALASKVLKDIKKENATG